MLMALMAAFRARQLSEDQAAAQGKDTGMERYRRKVERAPTAIRFWCARETITPCCGAWELATLAGLHLRDHATEDVAAILKRYGVLADDQNASVSGDPSP